MKVELLVCVAGLDAVHDRGAVVEYGDEEAARLVAAGFARPIRVAAVETTAAPGAPETTAVTIEAVTEPTDLERVTDAPTADAPATDAPTIDATE